MPKSKRKFINASHRDRPRAPLASNKNSKNKRARNDSTNPRPRKRARLSTQAAVPLIDNTKSTRSSMKKFRGSQLFRHRIMISTLTHTPIEINDIRSNDSFDDDESGLRDYEVNFLRLIDALTNGTSIEINETGTRLRFRPGTLVGKHSHEHDCPTTRGLTYWIEPMLVLLPFAKIKTLLVLNGAVYHPLDVSVDVLQGSLFPLLEDFGVRDILMKTKRRSLPPSGGGQITLSIPSVEKLRPVDCSDAGLIKRIRGVCYTIGVAPTIAQRVRMACNEVLLNYIPDIWVFMNHTKRHELQKHLSDEWKDKVSAGFGLSLIAETMNNRHLSIHRHCDQEQTAEEFGEHVANMLLQEVSYGGAIDSTIQSIVFVFMAICTEDVSRVRCGRLTQQSIHVLRLIRDQLGVTFRIKEDHETGTVFLSCMGIGFANVWRQAS